MLDLNKHITPYLTHVRSVPGLLLHEFYNSSIKYREELAQVFSEEYPKYLDLNRPREREADRAYRKTVYINPFRHLTNRMSESFDYIHQADDFEISFPAIPDGLDPELSLEKYSGPLLTPDGDLKDWFFNNCIDPYLLDPNACVAMVLVDLPENDENFASTGLFNPLPMLFPSDYVWMHRKGKLAVLRSPEKNLFIDEYGLEREGEIIHFFDHESYTVAIEVGRQPGANEGQDIIWKILGHSTESVIDLSGQIVQATRFEPLLHRCSGMPVRKLGKRRMKSNAKKEELYESLLADAVPKIKEAQQIQSDIQVERNFHVTSTEWRDMSSIPKCKHPQCTNGHLYKKGIGGDTLSVTQCPSCKGTGLNQPSGSNLEVLWVNRQDNQNIGSVKAGTTNNPGGYIEKSIEPLKQLTKDYRDVCRDVYTTINMQFIENVPLEVSGASKRYDREEMYRELNTQAAHLLALLAQQYKIGDCIRYGDREYVGEQTPEVLVPVRFNLENAELTREELNDAKLRSYDPALVHALEAKLLNYNSGKNADVYEQYQTRVTLDPYRDKDLDGKLLILGVFVAVLADGDARNLAVGEVMFSMMFDSILTEAYNTHDDFYQKDMLERNRIMREILPKYYQDIREMPVDPTMAGKGGALPNFSSYSIKPPVDLQNNQQLNDIQGVAGR